MTIFVSIAAYRDQELVATVLDCIARANQPQDLRFGIVWQHGDDERPLPFSGDRRFRILDLHWSESRGTCWARSEAMRLYNGEDWYLQIDSHHRFIQDWDAKLVYWAQRSRSPKPFLSAGQPGYDTGNDRARWPSNPRRMVFGFWSFGDLPNFVPDGIPDWRSLERPIRARYTIAHMCFAPGRLVEEVPYDPELYFGGEEITLGVRAFTWGYDLFHPPEVIAWHDYNFRHRRRHWDDHAEGSGVEVTGAERSLRAVEKVGRFLVEPWVGDFGAGTERSVADFEAYAGINFRLKKVQAYTLRGDEPPNPACGGEWLEQNQQWNTELVLDRARLPPVKKGESLRWALAFYNEDGGVIRSRHVFGAELERLESSGDEIRIQRYLTATSRPVTYSLSVMTADRGWLPTVRGDVARVLLGA